MNDEWNWSIETVDYKGKVGRYTSISLNSEDNPCISYADIGNYDLKYAYFDGSEWHVETVDSAGVVGIPTTLALDSKDHPHIAYCDFGKKYLKYAYFDGSEWHVETVDSGKDTLSHLAISIDSKDHPHIAYCDSLHGYLKYAYFDGSEWHVETVDTEGNTSWFSVGAHSMFMKNGYPNIIYGCGNKLKHAYKDENGWNIEIILVEGGEIRYASAVLDSKNYLHICYHGMENYDLRYVCWDGNEWRKEVILSKGYIGGSCSIALDSHDYPHIACYRTDSTQENDRDQEYVYWDGSKWNEVVIDSVGYVGGCCDIAIDSNDNPVISYCYWQHFDLKCARKTMNNPPEKPHRPLGFIIGFKDLNCTYQTSTIDRDGEQLYYMFDWGDGSVTDWLGPYASGERIKASHSWEKEGVYLIRVKAKDIHYSESGWSDPLPVSIPKIYFLKWTAIIEKYLTTFMREIIPLSFFLF